MSDRLKGQHLDFAGGETLSRKLLWAPQQKSTSLHPIHPLNHHQQNKLGLQILSLSYFRWIRALKAILACNNSWYHYVWVLEYRERSVMAGLPMLQNSMYIPGRRRWNRGAAEENKLCRTTWGNSHIFLFSENPLTASKVSFTASVNSLRLTRDCRTLQDKDKYFWPTTANIEIMSSGKTSNL